MALNLNARATLDTRNYMAGLKAMGAGTTALTNSNIANASKEGAADKSLQAQKIAGARQRVASEQASARAIARAHQESARASVEATRLGLSAQRYLYADMARMTARAAAGLAMVPLASLAAGVAWEKDFANVVRTADPVFANSEASVQSLRSSLVDLVQTMPASWGEVTEIATLANQMGIASSQTANFTKAVAMFSATSNVSVDQTATAFGRLQSIVPDIQGDFTGLADSILKVGVNSVATESEIINIVTQISSIAGSAGFTSKEMIGLSGALASVRVPPELSRGVVTRVFGQISRAAAKGGASLEGVAKIAGMTSEEFKDSWGSEGKSGKAFLSFVEGLRDLGPKAEQELRGLGITSVRDVPVMLRLANAKGSDGITSILRQTMGDAEDAAGEMQRQYTKMADTVAAKLKVAGNNIMAFFAEIGQSSLGPVGDILDTFSDSLRNLTNSLDDNAVAFGAFELPVTNAELLGWGTALAASAAGVLALGSAFLKAKQGMAGAKQLLSLMGGGARGMGADPTGVNRLNRSWSAFPGIVVSGVNRAERAVSTGFQSMTRQGRMVVAVQRDIDRAISRTTQGAASRMSSNNLSTSTAAGARGAVTAMRQYGVAANSATAQVSAAFSRAGSVVGSVARGMGAAASWAFGPWGLAAAVAIGAVASFVESTRAASTETSDLAEDLARLGTAGKSAQAIKNVQVGGLFGHTAKPLKEGLGTLEKYRDAALQVAEAENEITKNSTNRYVIAGRQAQINGTNIRATKEYGDALKIVNDAYTEMKDAGNQAGAINSILAGVKDFDGLMTDLGSGKLKEIDRDLEAAFDMNNLEYSKENLRKLANGELPAVREQLYGVSIAAGITADEMENFSVGGATGYTELVKKTEELARSFVSVGDAVKAATDEAGNFDASAFVNSMQEQIKATEDWAKNLGLAAKLGGSEFVSRLVELGDDARVPLQALVDDFNANGGKLSELGQQIFDSLNYDFTQLPTEYGASVGLAIDNIKAKLRNADLSSALQAMLSQDQLVSFADGMQAVGVDAATKLAEGITSGSITVDQALAMMAAGTEVQLDTDLNVTPAQLSLGTFAALANGTVTTMQLDALPTLAQGAIWETVQLANGSYGFVQIDGETGEAISDVAYVVNEANGAVGTIKLNGNDREAISKLNSVKSRADGTTGTLTITADASQAWSTLNALSNRNTYSTHTINVVEVRSNGARTATSWAGGMTRADGGIVEFFKNGGIKENHTADIAPAGTWRVWAEPETGGEAYIPLAKSKRLRSEAILADVANRFGYALQPHTKQFADGGQYMAQAMSRRQQTYAPVRTVAGGPGISIGEITLGGNNQTDQFRELTRHLNRVARGLA